MFEYLIASIFEYLIAMQHLMSQNRILIFGLLHVQYLIG